MDDDSVLTDTALVNVDSDGMVTSVHLSPNGTNCRLRGHTMLRVFLLA
jgi:hypothetical protein